jgi:hypothetical protein
VVEAPTPEWVDAALPEKSTARDSLDSDAGASPTGCLRWQGERAFLDCDQLVLREPLVVQPGYRVPREPARSQLAEVATLMRQHPEILLLRIDATTLVKVGAGPETEAWARRTAERHATAVFSQLWRREGISAERLEPVGHVAVGDPRGAVQIRLRVMQWRR